ncbi:lytic transglycosylase domain-containing protein [Nocardioides sp.]|uniref:lytic transglycosylase domain-containing protein n=1 Tax=Nocardioides sp. TaxID=35761 RepID=UPI00286B4D56|nr:lytic transglycosylase domain-containing protein [Nocardioides sp.]
MRRPFRSAASFVLALVAVSAVVFLLQQMLYPRQEILDLTPTSAPPTAPPPATAAAAPVSSASVVDPAWVGDTAARTGIPGPALLAYARATLRAPESCGLGWTTLAGIGWVESQHGTIGGRSLREDGTSSRRVLGPALDGVGPVAAIRATPESTSWHGDPEWDHAVGPMQFIPSTWEMWASDGDGDDMADPNDIDDAAWAAARYLCAGGQDLTTGSGWAGSIYSYNHAQVYVDMVYTAATTYAERIG